MITQGAKDACDLVDISASEPGDQKYDLKLSGLAEIKRQREKFNRIEEVKLFL